MKKIISLFLAFLISISLVFTVHAENPAWQEVFENVIENSAASGFLLMDVSGDGTPELFVSSGKGVAVYYYEGAGAVKAADDKNIPLSLIENLVRVKNTKDNSRHYMGQAMKDGVLVTYKMSFSVCVPVLETLAEEDLVTGAGKFKGSGADLVPSENVTRRVNNYLKDYEQEYLMKSCLRADEIRRLGKSNASKRLFSRYELLSSFADDSHLFSTNQRDEIKNNIGMKKFFAFDRITVLNDEVIFVAFYVNNTSNNEYAFGYDKKYALINDKFEVISTYSKEEELDTDYLWSQISPDTKASNFKPDYEKTEDFRGIDDYVKYFSSLLSQDKTINTNGKKEIVDFMEYAVNRCSRTELKAQKNVLTVQKKDASVIAQNAVNSMGQLQSVCASKNISQIRTPKTVPEFVCSGVDMSKPVRIEFEKGVAKELGQASGVRIMLDANHGVYVNAAELSVLEEEVDIFTIEFTKNKKDYSVVFTGKNNEEINSITLPVWFVVPAKSNYASVLATFDGGTENRGGQYNARYENIEFSAVRSGNYQIIEEDITINDIDTVVFSVNLAIRFLVSKGVLDVDRNNNFYPNKEMSRYDFTKAMVSMFYTDVTGVDCSYPDVDKDNEYYSFVAAAEALDISKAQADGNFGGDSAVTNEYMMYICGKILAEKKGYKFPENYYDYISFSDKDDISSEALPYIAVAVQCGLWDNSGEFLPNGAVTREKGAQVLYKTYTLLYDTSPVTTSFSALIGEGDEDTLKDLTPLHRVAICVGITVIMLLVFYAISKKRKQEFEPEETEDDNDDN